MPSIKLSDEDFNLLKKSHICLDYISTPRWQPFDCINITTGEKIKIICSQVGGIYNKHAAFKVYTE